MCYHPDNVDSVFNDEAVESWNPELYQKDFYDEYLDDSEDDIFSVNETKSVVTAKELT